MTEEDVKLRFITPALQKDWKGFISMEVSIDDGKICVYGNIAKREKPLRADYVLYMNEGRPLAVVEAKSDLYSVSAGLQQAKIYAEKLSVPFAYSSNGQGFEEYDYLTGVETFIRYDKYVQSYTKFIQFILWHSRDMPSCFIEPDFADVAGYFRLV